MAMKRSPRKRKKLKNKSKRKSQTLSKPKNKLKVKPKSLQLKKLNKLQLSTYKLQQQNLLNQNQPIIMRLMQATLQSNS